MEGFYKWIDLWHYTLYAWIVDSQVRCGKQKVDLEEEDKGLITKWFFI